jgi:hypothetical protein
MVLDLNLIAATAITIGAIIIAVALLDTKPL